MADETPLWEVTVRTGTGRSMTLVTHSWGTVFQSIEAFMDGELNMRGLYVDDVFYLDYVDTGLAKLDSLGTPGRIDYGRNIGITLTIEWRHHDATDRATHTAKLQQIAHGRLDCGRPLGGETARELARQACVALGLSFDRDTINSISKKGAFHG